MSRIDFEPVRFRIVSGAQDGADLGGLKAAKRLGITTGGYMPHGYLCERGPEVGKQRAKEYNLQECILGGYPERTYAVSLLASGLLWFGNPHSPGGKLSFRCAGQRNLDTFTVLGISRPKDVSDWIIGYLLDGETECSLWIAGNRASKYPDIEAITDQFVGCVLEILLDIKAIKAW